MICRAAESNFITSCKYIKSKNRYTSYTLQLSYLSDYSDEDIEGLFDISPEYTGEASYCDANDENDEVESEVSISLPDETTDLDAVPEIANNKKCTTSWATQAIKVAEYDLRQKGYTGDEAKLSAKYLFQCMSKEYGGEEDDGCNGYTNNEIYSFIEDHGLMTEKQAENMDVNLCDPTYNPDELGMYKFEVVKLLPCANKYTLMRELSQGRPMSVLLALDGNRARHLHDISAEEDAAYTGATDDPTTWGIVTGYKKPAEDQEEGVWNVQTDFSLKETVKFKLPMRNNDTNANYAGIAAYAFYLNALVATQIPPTTEVPPTEAPIEPTTEAPIEPTTEAPEVPTTEAPTTEAPIEPTTEAPEVTTVPPTPEPTTIIPTTETPTTPTPTTEIPTLPPNPLDICPQSGPAVACKEGLMERTDRDTITDLTLCRCNDLTSIDFSMFPHLRTINIERIYNFESFSIENMQDLTSVKIGLMGASGQGGVCTLNSTVTISNNPVLTELIIAENAFQRFCRVEIMNNPVMTYLGLGAELDENTNTYKYNTAYGCFFTATDAIIADMPMLKEIHAGGAVLYSFQDLVMKNLTSLEVFQHFTSAFQGHEYGASLTMKSNC